MDERALCNNKDKKMEAIKIIRYLSPVGEMMIVIFINEGWKGVNLG